MIQFKDIPTSTAWSFTHLLPGTFKRNKQEFAHHDYPILAPLPTHKGRTEPLEAIPGRGPFIYFVVDAASRLCYIGKSQEESVLKRWIRPGIGGPSTHYWTHSTRSGGSVFNIAEGLRRAEGPFHLHVTTLENLLSRFGQLIGVNQATPIDEALEKVETYLIGELKPLWNR